MRRATSTRELSPSLRFPATENDFKVAGYAEDMNNDNVSSNPDASPGPRNVGQVLVRLDAMKAEIIEGKQNSVDSLGK